MNRPEIQKLKDDPVYFAEKYLGLELADWQKHVLYAYQKGQSIRSFGVRSGKTHVSSIIRQHQEFKEKYK